MFSGQTTMLQPGLLEEAVEPMRSDFPPRSQVEIAAISQAISLKRIADALTGSQGNAPLFDAGHSFGAGIEQVAFSIGQQIKRGMEAG